ncbi:MAG: histidine triad nucleotide-binding protein [Candidatus Kryptonium sp.]
MRECIFCEIIAGRMPADFVYEDDEIVAFKDINPQAPIHILVVPRRHFSTLLDLKPEDAPLAGRLLIVANEVAKKFNIHSRGFRLVFNCNREAGQSIYHVHLHLLGGRIMMWPPG